MKTFRQFLAEDKEYTAFVRDKETGDATQITRTYPSMKDFKRDLRSNGYRVMSVSPSGEVGSAEWERKLYDNREKRKQRKSDRLERKVDKIIYVQQKTAALSDRWHQLSNEMNKYELGTPEFRAAADASHKAYQEYEKARKDAEEEFERMNK